MRPSNGQSFVAIRAVFKSLNEPTDTVKKSMKRRVLRFPTSRSILMLQKLENIFTYSCGIHNETGNISSAEGYEGQYLKIEKTFGSGKLRKFQDSSNMRIDGESRSERNGQRCVNAFSRIKGPLDSIKWRIATG